MNNRGIRKRFMVLYRVLSKLGTFLMFVSVIYLLGLVGRSDTMSFSGEVESFFFYYVVRALIAVSMVLTGFALNKVGSYGYSIQRRWLKSHY